MTNEKPGGFGLPNSKSKIDDNLGKPKPPAKQIGWTVGYTVAEVEESLKKDKKKPRF